MSRYAVITSAVAEVPVAATAAVVVAVAAVVADDVVGDAAQTVHGCLEFRFDHVTV